jgi:hypothetical protein
VGTVRVGEFEWNETKARANVRKRGVTFEELPEQPSRLVPQGARALFAALAVESGSGAAIEIEWYLTVLNA